MPLFACDQISAMRMSINEAIKDPARRDLSIQAIEKEIRNLMNMNTGTYIRFQDIPREEVGGIINCFMFLKDKVDGKGEFTSLKSRMVASKTRKIFEDLSSPTANPITVMTLLHINAVRDYELSTYELNGHF